MWNSDIARDEIKIDKGGWGGGSGGGGSGTHKVYGNDAWSTRFFVLNVNNFGIQGARQLILVLFYS